ncbi:hypothetical protein AURDEDRAFT_177244 [Auricularia subglabra TFB-10046 SS5]|uniref:MYND-type domain-containing protein n=1 Tax=Auricularia subglabra (strain TFB-10046 / SS5) TaxID=717982 RepID=J0CTM5_AURST|nr:hypothetical protein AURDEDRAFT_177244 [Auricularia subglabra TFB-10046 SS5]
MNDVFNSLRITPAAGDAASLFNSRARPSVASSQLPTALNAHLRAAVLWQRSGGLGAFGHRGGFVVTTGHGPPSCSCRPASSARSRNDDTIPAPVLTSPFAAAILRRLAVGLQDFRNPAVCMRIVDRVYLHPRAAHPNVQLLRAHHSNLLSQFMAVLACRRTVSDGVALAASLHSAIQSCPGQADPFHCRLADDFNPSTCPKDLVASLCAIVTSCFPPITVHSIRTQKFKFHALWPSGPQDLLHGPATFCGLLHWLPTADDTAVVCTFMRVFLWCRPAFYSEFDDPSARIIFVRAMCSLLKSLAASLSLPHTPVPFGRTDAAHHLTCVAQLLEFLPMFGVDEWPQWRYAFIGFEQNILSAVYAAVDACPRDRYHVKAQLRDFALHVHSSLGDEWLVSMPEDLSHHMFHAQLRFGGCFAHFRHLLDSIFSRKVCAAPNCDNIFPSQSRLMLCSRCKILRYCSKRCQAEHWRSPSHPHKPVCARLAPIVNIAHPRNGLDDFEDACRSLGLDVDQLSIIYVGLIGHRLYSVPQEDHDTLTSGQ